MMKITALQGSPYINGSSNMLANEFIRGAKESGHTCHIYPETDMVKMWEIRRLIRRLKKSVKS